MDELAVTHVEDEVWVAAEVDCPWFDDQWLAEHTDFPLRRLSGKDHDA